jgi:hypothetical protein
MELTRRVGMTEAIAKGGVGQLAGWADWRRIYQQLLHEGRVWDLHDALLTAVTYYTVEEALEEFLGPDSSVDRLVTDWTTPELDESTQLALLDILSVIILHSSMRSTLSPVAKHCLTRPMPSASH